MQNIGNPKTHKELFRENSFMSCKDSNQIPREFLYILVLYLNVINSRTFLSFLVGGGFSEHVRHLGFLLRTMLFYDAYAEAPV